MINPSVEIYSTPTCPDCKEAKSFFKQNHIDYTEYDIDEQPEKADELKTRTGKTLVPTIFIHGKGPFFGFAFNRTEIEELLAVGNVN